MKQYVWVPDPFCPSSHHARVNSSWSWGQDGSVPNLVGGGKTVGQQFSSVKHVAVSRFAVEEVLLSVRAALQQVQRSVPRLLRRRSSVPPPCSTVSFQYWILQHLPGFIHESDIFLMVYSAFLKFSFVFTVAFFQSLRAHLHPATATSLRHRSHI